MSLVSYWKLIYNDAPKTYAHIIDEIVETNPRRSRDYCEKKIQTAVCS